MGSFKSKDNEESIIFVGTSSLITKNLINKYSGAILIDRTHKFFNNPKGFVRSLEEEKRYAVVYSSAVIRDKLMADQSDDMISESFKINCYRFVQLIELMNAKKMDFKAIYISSESAKKGSYDTSYWLSKVAVESFIREIRLKNPKSSIVGIAPSTIRDGAMTIARKDRDRLLEYKKSHPKVRFLNSSEVEATILWCLESAPDYFTNTILEINGGKFSRRKIQ